MLEDYQINLIKIDKVSIPDGMGGFENGYKEGALFKGVLNVDTSAEMKIAEKQGVTSKYDLMVNKNIPLDYNDIFRRKSDGKNFRITSNRGDGESPEIAEIQIITFSAELHELR